MAINKQPTLGKKAQEAGIKDAVHVAIVSCRAGGPLSPGDRVKLNEYREAIKTYSKDYIGVADPFIKGGIDKGSFFWLVMKPNETEAVRHVWDHELDFSAPDREVQECKWIKEYADDLGVSYQFLMDAARKAVNGESSPKYEGTKTQEEIEEVLDDFYDFWYYWSEETGYEFENCGSACCPEYEHPSSFSIFDYSEAKSEES